MTVPDRIAAPEEISDDDLADLLYISAAQLQRGDVWFDMGVERTIDHARYFEQGNMVQYRIGTTIYTVPRRRSMWVLRNRAIA